MTTIYDQIKQDVETARFNKDLKTITVLSTIIGEIDLKKSVKSNKPFDYDIASIQVIKANVESSTTMLALSKDEKYKFEIDLISKYLPQNMSDEEVISILKEQGFQQVKDVMQFFKKLGKPVDMKRVQELYKSQEQ